MRNRKNPKSKKSVWGAIASTLVAAGLASGLGAAPASAAAVQPDVTSSVATQTPAADGSLSHSGKGTYITFLNESGAPMKVGDTVVPGGGRTILEGKNGDGDDVSTTVSDESGKQIKLYGHNPRFQEAYLQFEGTKVYENSVLESGGMHFRVEYRGELTRAHKSWSVTALNHAKYTHTFVHRTTSEDGTKGTVVNNASRDATIQLAGKDYLLKPGQSLLFFDAHQFESGPFSINKGIHMCIHHERSESRLPDPRYNIKMWDTLASKPQATVGKDGSYDRDHSFSENTSRSYHWGGWRGLNVDITREADGRMEVAQETSSTKDWAHFTVRISDSAKQ